MNYFRGLGKGIDTAIENGYVENPGMDYIESNTTLSKETGTIVEDVKVDAKIEDFLMDDLILSTQFSFEFDETIHNYIDLNNINDVTINDLFVRDEENRLIYSVNDKEIFEKQKVILLNSYIFSIKLISKFLFCLLLTPPKSSHFVSVVLRT